MTDSGTLGGETEQFSDANPETVWYRWRFPIVLFSSLLLAVGQPLSLGFVTQPDTSDVLCSLLILAVMLLVFEEQHDRRKALPLGLSALLALWTSHACADPASRWLLISAYLMAAGFITFALYGIVTEMLLLRTARHAVLRAVCGYLLLGIIWMLMYTAVEVAVPGSFRIPVQEDTGAEAPGSVRSMLGYFSFITLATVGYGDVTPVTPLARTLAWLEAVVGQFYLGVLVAGLVGFKVTQSLERESTMRNRV